MTVADARLVAQLRPAQRVGLTIYGEARGGSDALRRGIGSVIANRVRAHRPRWGVTADEVATKPGQFSCWSSASGAANFAAVMQAARAVLDDVDRDTLPRLRECLALGVEVVAGVLADTVSGATHYYAPAAMVPRDRVPAWAIGLQPVAEIDGTRFFSGVR